MLKKPYLTVAAALILATITGCSNNSPVTSGNEISIIETQATTEPDTPTEKNEELKKVDSLKSNSIEHISQMIDIIGTTKNENIILSATSLDMAMGMLYQGATGDAEKALRTYYNADAEEKINHDNQLIDTYNNYKNADVLLSNAIYSNEGITICPDFLDIIRNKYYADVQNLNFSDTASADIINKFCSDHTNEMIKKIITPDSLKDKTTVILNALYFNADWKDKFYKENTRDTDFHNVDGSIATITGMYEGLNKPYYETENAKGFAKYYEGSEFAFIGILPDESIVDENNNFNITDIDIDALLESESSKKVEIMMPKFKIEDTNSLTNCLIDQGLESLFEGNDNFNKLSDIDMKVSEVLQKVVVDVDENGTEAAAVTIIGMDATAMPEKEEPKSVILDRPFAFMIYDTINEEALFVGKVVNL